MKCTNEGRTVAVISSKSGTPLVETSIDGELYLAVVTTTRSLGVLRNELIPCLLAGTVCGPDTIGLSASSLIRLTVTHVRDGAVATRFFTS